MRRSPETCTARRWRRFEMCEVQFGTLARSLRPGGCVVAGRPRRCRRHRPDRDTLRNRSPIRGDSARPGRLVRERAPVLISVRGGHLSVGAWEVDRLAAVLPAHPVVLRVALTEYLEHVRRAVGPGPAWWFPRRPLTTVAITMTASTTGPAKAETTCPD